MTQVKICGITDVSHVRATAEAGADLIGVNFAPSSPRQLNPEKAKEIASAAKEYGLSVVGIFVNTPAAEVNSLATSCGLDRVQLSGDEGWDYCRQMEKPVIKAVHIAPDWDEEKLIHHLESGQRELQRPAIYLLDTHVEAKYGGTGQPFAWDIARPAAERYPVIIAGGLDPENVGRVVAELKPWGVDVSSGVESGGVKDIEKIKAFVAAAKAG